ncbi:MAG: hypothetical protein ACTSRB_11840 [Candidatus Helarchaeota archaeon]
MSSDLRNKRLDFEEISMHATGISMLRFTITIARSSLISVASPFSRDLLKLLSLHGKYYNDMIPYMFNFSPSLVL